MCGRYTLTYSGEQIARIFAAMATPSLFEGPRYNVAPTQQLPVVVQESGGQRQVKLMRWGLVPRWAEDQTIGNRLINARAETVASKPAFRDAMYQRRCLVPADGFYEWQRTEGGSRQPFHVQVNAGSLFAFAGLWERWQPADQQQPPLESFTIITTDANPALREIHTRMPVILHSADWATWLDAASIPPERAEQLLQSWEGPMQMTPVNKHVNNPRHDDPHCLDPLMWR